MGGGVVDRAASAGRRPVRSGHAGHCGQVGIARADTLAEPGAAGRFADALRRSVSATADVIALDHFSYADVALDKARERFGIVPKAVPGPGWRD